MAAELGPKQISHAEPDASAKSGLVMRTPVFEPVRLAAKTPSALQRPPPAFAFVEREMNRIERLVSSVIAILLAVAGIALWRWAMGGSVGWLVVLFNLIAVASYFGVRALLSRI